MNLRRVTNIAHLVKDVKGNLLADAHKILNRWKNYFSQLLNVHGAGGGRQTEMHTAEPFMLVSSASEAVVAVGMLKRYNTPGADHILAEVIQAGGGGGGKNVHK
jgi:hypothetical protein